MKFNVGDKVKKVTGDYSFDGTVVAAFQKTTGEERYVVEHKEMHMLHIFNENQMDFE